MRKQLTLAGGLVLAMTASGVAQQTRTLFCLAEGAQIAADRFETRDGKFFLYVTGSVQPLEYPIAQVRGVNTNCPAMVPPPKFGIHGSNTIGERLMPMLIDAFGRQRLKMRPLSKPTKPEEQEITLVAGAGTKAVVDLQSHGSGTAAQGLAGGTATIGMSSRRMKKDEADAVISQSLIDPLTAGSEHVLALDGLAVIVHPANPVTKLTLDQIAGIFSGQIATWDKVGGAPRPILVNRRDDKSGTFDTFKSLVLEPRKAKIAPTATKFESSEKLSAAVAASPDAIGFIGIPYVNKSRALQIATSCGLTSAPSRFAIKTEEYPLSRRLYLYTVALPTDQTARDVLAFSLSDSAQAVIEDAGFINQAVDFQEPAEQQRWAQGLLKSPRTLLAPDKQVSPEALRVFTNLAKLRRASVVFRFTSGTYELDTRGLQDVRRLARYLRSQGAAGKPFTLVGFADANGPWAANLGLAAKRAETVAASLRQAGVEVAAENITSLSYFAPVACNDSEDGRTRNRRVEVWIAP